MAFGAPLKLQVRLESVSVDKVSRSAVTVILTRICAHLSELLQRRSARVVPPHSRSVPLTCLAASTKHRELPPTAGAAADDDGDADEEVEDPEVAEAAPGARCSDRCQ